MTKNILYVPIPGNGGVALGVTLGWYAIMTFDFLPILKSFEVGGDFFFTFAIPAPSPALTA